MDRKKVREKQRAVKDAMKLQKAVGQLEAKAAEAGKEGDPFAKFFGAMAGALGDLINQAQAEAEAGAEAEHLVDDLPFGHVVEDNDYDDELMEDEEDV